ncbi:hypothetical protein [Pelagicoccus sp. SDUM812003]|uniref:hypothetical protein n=1 Tax=Pelagicoccus sp. SDUM812003 TaxID=3041267 RepID=UPI00280EADD1|nr:hypothetical protein [Pelagicoccus sp. SDUM812003]MDQ8201966.1 hypothetical protein [Pelagicoccus sp. SDUM812003]
MKSISILTAIALCAALLTPNTAKAGDSEDALIGGLVGGLIIGAVLADNDVDTRFEVGYRSHRGHHDGYWTWVSRKKWVPGYYERRRDHCGNRIKVWVSGHYTYVKEKVWVSHRDHRGHDRYDRCDRRGHHDNCRSCSHDSRHRDDRYRDRHHRDYANRF